MPRPRRNTDPQYLRLVTIRTEQARLFMVPGRELNETVGGIVAKYQQEFAIEIYAYTFLSNHYHLLVRAPKENLWKFEQALNREIAKRVNRLRYREGHFWSRRYDEQVVVGNAASLTALIYIICNAVRHRLVRDVALWPGVSCFFHVLDEQDRTFHFTDYTAYRKAKREAQLSGKRVELSDYRMSYLLHLSPLPMLCSLNKKLRRQFLRSEIQKQVTLLQAEADRDVKGFLHPEFVLSQDPFSWPREVSRRMRPICYTQDPEAKHIFLTEVHFPWNAAYEVASKEFRSGILNAEFPPHAIKPPVLYLMK